MELSSAAEFVRLRSSQDPHDYGAADRGTATVNIWREVLADHPDFRRWVAHNKTVPLEILETLAVDTDPRVRAAVASQQSLTEALFDLLAADDEDAVRLRIVHNAATPRPVLERLVHDPYDLVSARARVRLGGITSRSGHAEPSSLG
ncbi:MAG: hypothetical protein ABWX96_02750 [Propionibacteriaceae bacterium]